MSGYLDTQTPGMKNLLEEVAKQDDVPTEAWLKGKEVEYGRWVCGDREKLWRALKALTEGDALRAVEAAGNEDGYAAWQELHRLFEPRLTAMQGRVLNEMSSLTKTKARDPAETRKMVTELITRIRTAEEITGEKISDTHAKSILLGFIDDVTRQKTTDYHGTETRYEKLRTEVLKFTNNMGGDEGAPNEKGKGPTPCKYDSSDNQQQTKGLINQGRRNTNIGLED